MGKQRKWKAMLSMLLALGMLGSYIIPVAAEGIETEHELVELDKGTSTDLIRNGSFEEGSSQSSRTGWSTTGQGSFSNYDGANVAADGEWYGLLPANTNNACVYQNLTLKANTDYVATAKIQVAVAGAYAFFNAKTNNVATLIPGAEVKVTCTKEQEWVWQDIRLEFNTGNNTNVQLCVMKWVDANETDSPVYKSQFYVDSVTLQEVSSSDETEDDNYEIIWADDFNESTLNMDNWGYELGCIRGQEQQHYVADKENVFMRDGNLVLKATDRAKEDQYQNPRNKNKTVIYNSGSVRTHGKQEFLYGRIEMRAKLPKGNGVFPAFWTLGADFTLDGDIASNQGYGWARCGEIDIMELIGGKEGNYHNKTVWQTIHTDDGTVEDNGKLAGQSYRIDEDFYNDYHIFGINWSKNKMEWYVDNQIVCRVDYSDASVKKNAIAQKALNRPHYIQMNLAMGGSWVTTEVGNLDPNLAGTEYVIDYVYYAQNEQQKADAAQYYENAPVLNGLKDVTMVEGDTADLLKDVTVTDGYDVDYSIENGPMFQTHGGMTSVDLLCTGKNDKESLANLPAGTYNIHYSAMPKNMQLDSSNKPLGTEDYKFARKTMTLTVTERTFPSDWTLEGTKGHKLSSVALPVGWSWDNPDTILDQDGQQSVTFTNESYTKTVNVFVWAKAPTIIEGNNSSWVSDSQEGLSFKSDGHFETFQTVKVDGKVIDASNYTVTQEPTIVTLKADYLKSLSAGDHTITIVSSGGEATAQFTVLEKTTASETNPIPTNPSDHKNDNNTTNIHTSTTASVNSHVKTGDQTMLIGYAAMMLISTVVFVIMKKKKAMK